METNDRRIIEILLAGIFIVFLFLVILFVINLDSKETTITNSYNTYNIYPASRTQYVSMKPYIVDRIDYAQVYYVPKDFTYAEPDDRYLRYYEYGRLKESTGLLFNNDINRYEVYVKNREYVGGYFKVIFYFEDYYGKTRSETITHYIPAREEKLFLLKDISPSEYKYRRWWYEVTTRTKVPTRVYYN